MSLALFDLAPPIWRPIYTRHGDILTVVFLGLVCRDCGAKVDALEAGGSDPFGNYAVCALCVPLDPHWGHPRPADMAGALDAREARRAAARRKQVA